MAAKTPQEKKTLSLTRDTRNSYGENAKASRKLIPLLKQQSHQARRRQARAPLRGALGPSDVELQDHQEGIVLAAEVAQQRASFKKSPDISLGMSLERKRVAQAGTSRKNFGRRPV